jgi:4'-phosphopantetheinyl transferase
MSDTKVLVQEFGDLAYGQVMLRTQNHTRLGRDEIDHLKSLLSDEELQRNSNLPLATHRRRDIACRGGLRQQLSQLLNTPPGKIQLTRNRNGKPLLESSSCALYFNCSYGGDYIAFAFCNGVEIGVDIEYILRRSNSLGVAQHFFSPREAADLRALPEEQQRQRFFQYWTLKEAYLKARGEGIFLGLDKFSFHLPASEKSKIGISFCSDSFDQAHHWQFHCSSPVPNYQVAIAIRTARPIFTIV